MQWLLCLELVGSQPPASEIRSLLVSETYTFTFQRESSIELNSAFGNIWYLRALLRMDGEDVFGSKLSVHCPNQPYHSSAESRMPKDLLSANHHTKDMIGAACKRHFTPFPPPPNPAKVAPPRLLNLRPRCTGDDQEVSSALGEFSTEMVVFILITCTAKICFISLLNCTL